MAIGSLSSSGQYINIDSLVQNAVRVQQQRVSDLQTQKSSTDTQISTLGKVKSQLASLEDKFKAINTAFNNFTVSGAPEGATITAKDKGIYSVSVDNLASTQIIASQTASPKGPLGYSGTMVINTGSYDNSNAFNKMKDGIEIKVEATDTLEDIAKKINSSDSGVSANIINGSDGQHLSFSGNGTGKDNAFQIITNDTNSTGLSSLSYQQGTSSRYNNVAEAKDGQATVNGLTVTSANNNFSVNDNFSFVATKEFAKQTISVKRDDTVVTKAINDFVTAYNTATTTLKNQDVDNQLKNFTSQIRDTLGRVDYSNSVANIGLSFDKNGILSFDSNKFNKFASGSSENMKNLLNNQFGKDSSVVALFERQVSSNGSIENKVSNLTEKSRKLEGNISNNKNILESQTKNYQLQFAQLDQYLAQLNDNSGAVGQLLKQFNNE